MEKTSVRVTEAERKALAYVAERGSIEYCDGTGVRYVTIANLVAKGLLRFERDIETRAYGSSTWSGCVAARTIRLWKAVAA